MVNALDHWLFDKIINKLIKMHLYATLCRRLRDDFRIAVVHEVRVRLAERWRKGQGRPLCHRTVEFHAGPPTKRPFN